jgi:hypothetical protein
MVNFGHRTSLYNGDLGGDGTGGGPAESEGLLQFLSTVRIHLGLTQMWNVKLPIFPSVP